MRWDDAYLYVGAHMEETDVWGTLTEHNSVIFHDNDFEVFVDTDGTNHNYKEFEINALGTTWCLHLNKPYDNGGIENSKRVDLVDAKHRWFLPEGSMLSILRKTRYRGGRQLGVVKT